MPFNRDLIESGCALKTFDGDLSVLERVIDWTVTKPGFADQQCKPFGYDVARRQRVLCTGGVGYIGSHTVVKLVEHGFQVAIADASLSTSVTVLERLRDLTGENIPFFEVDMNDEVAIDRLFQEQQFDGVVHCAGLPADSGSAEDPMQFYESNVVGTMAVLKAMENHNCKHIVFSSSASVYEPSDQPITESQPLGPSCLFGRTKFMTEQILSDACQANKGLAVSVLRCFNTCGAHRSGRIGSEQSEMAFMSSMQQFGIRDCIHVDDVAEGHALALKKLCTTGSGITFHNLGSGKGVSAVEMAKAYQQISKTTTGCNLTQPMPNLSYISNSAKARTELGWQPKCGLAQIVGSACKWKIENPFGYGSGPSMK